MPNRDKHLLIGAVAGLAVYSLESKNVGVPLNLGDAIPYMLGGGIVGCLPDILEPALNPNHRQFFHSLAFGGGLGFYLDSILKDQKYDSSQKLLAKVLIASYGSHLFIDGTTPKGLPIL